MHVLYKTVYALSCLYEKVDFVDIVELCIWILCSFCIRFM